MFLGQCSTVVAENSKTSARELVAKCKQSSMLTPMQKRALDIGLHVSSETLNRIKQVCVQNEQDASSRGTDPPERADRTARGGQGSGGRTPQQSTVLLPWIVDGQTSVTRHIEIPWEKYNDSVASA